MTATRGLVSDHPSSPTCVLPERENQAALFADDGCGPGLVNPGGVARARRCGVGRVGGFVPGRSQVGSDFPCG